MLSRYRFEISQIAGLFVLGCVVYWAGYHGGSETIRAVLNNHRATVYGTLTSVFGALFGFIITSTSIMSSMQSSSTMKFMQGTAYYPELWRFFTRGAKMLAVTTLVCLVGLIVNSHDVPCRRPVFELVTLGFAMNAILHVGRCLFALHAVIESSIANAKRQLAAQQGQTS
jgi:hypothetical protein